MVTFINLEGFSPREMKYNRMWDGKLETEKDTTTCLSAPFPTFTFECAFVYINKKKMLCYFIT